MTVTMYDDTNLALIPADASAVAGYVNGRYVTYPAVVRRWPLAEHLSIAVSSAADADCLDVERGDATNDVAPAWVERQIKRGAHRPVVYTSASNAKALLGVLAAAGISRELIRLWTAHYTGRKHFCGPGCGFGIATLADATQWTDRSQGRSLDETVCSDSFFAAAPAPKPKPKPTPLEPWESRSHKETAWRLLVFGEGKHAPDGPRTPPYDAPVEWKDRAILFLIRRTHKEAPS